MTVLWNALCGDDFNQTPVSKIFSEKIQFFFCFGGRCITGESDLVAYGPRGGRVARREKRELERPRIVQNLGELTVRRTNPHPAVKAVRCAKGSM